MCVCLRQSDVCCYRCLNAIYTHIYIYRCVLLLNRASPQKARKAAEWFLQCSHGDTGLQVKVTSVTLWEWSSSCFLSNHTACPLLSSVTSRGHVPRRPWTHTQLAESTSSPDSLDVAGAEQARLSKYESGVMRQTLWEIFAVVWSLKAGRLKQSHDASMFDGSIVEWWQQR